MINRKHFIDQLSQLVATPSVSCTLPSLDMGNRRVIDLLANWLQDLGFTIDIQPLADNPEKANLVATLGQGSGGLVFAGHTDTVPFNAERWQQDPFTLTIDDERAFGLGATDMKGFFPAVIAAVQPFLDKPLKQAIIILATADEETSMAGARELLRHDLFQHKPAKASYAVIGEPTNMQPIRMHKGITMERIRVEGKAGHSSNPALGNNALDAMHEVISELIAFRQQLQQDYRHPGFVIDVPTLNLGCIHGGDNPNRICGSCELEFDLRPLPGMSLVNLREDIDCRLQALADKKQIKIKRQSLFPGIDAFEQAEGSTLVDSVERLTGQSSDSVAFATEAPFLQQLGMEVVIMGPGSIDQAHQPDEFIDLSTIDASVSTLKALIQQFCCQ